MRKFLKKRWHSIPIGVITAVFLVCALVGSVFAAYTFWSGTVDISVQECMTVSNLEGDSGDVVGGVWTVSMLPGETKVLYLRISNASSAGILVTPGFIDSSPTGVTAVWAPTDYTISGGGSKNFVLTLVASVDASPVVGATFTINFSRG